MYTYELSCNYDTHKSFYGKAIVAYFRQGNYFILYSYGTRVATIEDGKLIQCELHKYSRTTDRHIREFLKQMDLTENDLVA